MEKRVVSHYANLARHEVSMLRKKSRVQWMELGDSNNHFFHSTLKERRCRNNILTLKDELGHTLEDDKEIAFECTKIYLLYLRVMNLVVLI